MNATAQPLDVFLSYSRKDRVRADAVFELLARHGLNCWMDRSLRVGDEWAATVSQKLIEAKQFVLLGSSSSYQSVWVKKELHHAANSGAGYLHHVIIESADMPPEIKLLLADRHFLDASGPDGNDVIERELIPVLRAQLQRSQEEMAQREAARGIGTVASSITEAFERLGLGSSGDAWLADLIEATHRERLKDRHRVSESAGDRLVAIIDSSRALDGTGSIALLSNRLSWHDPQVGAEVQWVSWRDVVRATWSRWEFDGTGVVGLGLANGTSHELRVYCQSESFGKSVAKLVEEVSARSRKATPLRARAIQSGGRNEG